MPVHGAAVLVASPDVTEDRAPAVPPAVRDVVAWLDGRFPPTLAQPGDPVGLGVGVPDAPVRRILLAVECVPETADEAVAVRADLMITHHPLLYRGVHSVAASSYKGSIVHRLIGHGIAQFAAHTNADAVQPGVSDALAGLLGLTDVRLLAEPGHPGAGRVARLPRPMTLHELTAHVAARLPETPMGVRAAGPPDRLVATVALVAGAGDEFLADVTRAGVDAYLTGDLRHHPASDHLHGGGPVLIDASHWATERPWLDALAPELRGAFPVEVIVSDLVTDVWTEHVSPVKEPSP
jgi:dinuclear metal center YbgI/SA1388 family protein